MIKLITSNSTEPFYNLAIEEWLVRNIDTSTCDYLFLYENEPSVIIGRNQNVFQEVNLPYCKEHNIDICRRVSGGGTVYHDLKNLNWTFVSKFDTTKVNNYQTFAEPIIKVLKRLGLETFLNDRNAIMVGDIKVSGQAQFTNRKNILSHGTLLIDSNLNHLENSIQTKGIKVTTKASPSVRSDVKTIKMLLNKEITVEDLKTLIIEECNAKETFAITNEQIQKDINVIESNYKLDTWIYERSSKCTIEQIFNNENVLLEILKGKVIAVKNKKGENLHSHLLLNSYYKDCI